MKTVSEHYCNGILEGREYLKRYGMADAAAHLENLKSLCRQFDAKNPVGQLFRGERDFWINQIKKAKA